MRVDQRRYEQLPLASHLLIRDGLAGGRPIENLWEMPCERFTISHLYLSLVAIPTCKSSIADLLMQECRLSDRLNLDGQDVAEYSSVKDAPLVITRDA